MNTDQFQSNPNPTTQTGGGDMLDKATDFVERKAGHEQSHSTTEKISDGIRKVYQKATGKEMPVKDKNYQ